MSSNSNNKGRAYEYACINALQNALSERRTARIIMDSSYDTIHRAWGKMDGETRRMFEVSAQAAIETIFELEPSMTEDDGDELILVSQKDSNGIQGDVRDIVIKREEISWEIGLSVKHNHAALKHSRLSSVLDFGESWFGIPCSQEYWQAVQPIFDMLEEEKKKGTLWKEIDKKAERVYVPILEAFMDEVRRANESDPTMPRKMLEYLIGKMDYHKVISRDKKRLTLIHTFNIHGTLGRSSGITIPIIKLPTELICIRRSTKKKNTTVEMYLNNGWQLSFRIHSAKTEVEPSLKFDVEFIGTPESVMTFECKWH